MGLMRSCARVVEAVSTTTRPPRDGERDGADYNFVTTSEFNQRISDGRFIEYVVTNGNLYGVEHQALKKAVERNSTAVMVVEPEGCKSIRCYAKNNNIKVVSIFLSCPIETQYVRLLQRFANDDNATVENYAQRMAYIAEHETSWAQDADYDLVFGEFNQETQENILRAIIVEITDGPSRHSRIQN